MRPSFLDSMSYAMSQVYASVTDKIFVNIAKHFPFYDPDAETPGVFEYQAKMLAQMGQVRKETVDIIMQNLDGADDALRTALEAAIMDALKDETPKLRDAAQKGLLGTAEPPEVAPNQMNAFRMYYKQSADKLNLVNTVMLESTESAYRQTVSNICSVILKINHTQDILNASTGEVVTGVSAWNSAMHGAVRKMVENGLTGFIDHAGRRWSPEAYVAMDIKTTMFNTAREAVWENANSFGSDLYQVSSHNGARPLCYPWQGKVISRTDRVREVQDLDGNKIHVYAQSETTYGQAAGLFGINCKHYPMTFIPGVSTLRGQPQDPEENEQAYAESQEQRALERKLRKEKLDLSVLKAEGADEEMIKAQRDRVRKASADIDDFCDRTGRARRRNREYTPINASFPDKDSYDPARFPKKQQEEMQKHYKGGKDKNAPTWTNNTLKQLKADAEALESGGFIPAKTIEQAEEFAKQTFIDESNGLVRWGVSYKGMGLDAANEANKTIAEFYQTYNVKKFSSITAPNANTKVGRLVSGACAGYSPPNHAIILNKQVLKTLSAAAKHLEEEADLTRRYLEHPENFKVNSSLAKSVLEHSRVSGRSTVPKTFKETLWHELGHSLERGLRSVDNYDAIKAGYSTYAERISGYATSQFGEYIAESFCAWNKGEEIDPELIKGFNALKR